MDSSITCTNFGNVYTIASAVVHIDRKEAASILFAVRQITEPESIKKRIKVTSALEILETRERVQHQPGRGGNEWARIHTNCKDLDAWLNGGIPVGFLTEFYGEAGTGKTQFCLQLCVNVQKPQSLAGFGGEALFIDGEGCFRPNRLFQIANGALASWTNELTPKEKERGLIDENGQSLTVESVLEHIHLLRIHSPQQLTVAILNRLESFLSCHPKIRLVVLDGMSYQLRFMENVKGYKDRTDVITLIVQLLRRLADEKWISFVITNQISDDFVTKEKKPALGERWSRTCSYKFYLERKYPYSAREISLIKAPELKPCQFRYTVTKDGIK